MTSNHYMKYKPWHMNMTYRWNIYIYMTYIYKIQTMTYFRNINHEIYWKIDGGDISCIAISWLYLDIFEIQTITLGEISVETEIVKTSYMNSPLTASRFIWAHIFRRSIYKLQLKEFMMTSSNGNIFLVTGHLCREFTGPRWIPRTKANDAELWCFLWYAPE